MIDWIAALFLVIGFIAFARLFGLVDKSERVFTVSRHAVDVVRSHSLSDDEKEAALRDDSKRLFGLFLMITISGAAAVLLPSGLLWVCDRLALISMSSVLNIALSLRFVVASGVIVLTVMWWCSRESAETTRYSPLERAMHRVAFKTYAAQISVADVEDAVLSDQLSGQAIDRPVFIAGLPRAGTTLLLERLVSTGEFASHCYRDMPFILMPWLWNRFSTVFRKDGGLQERAHGDGMMIDYDSPEAFEEVIWRSFWEGNYPGDRVIPWPDKHGPEFSEFFGNHIRKIVLLRKEKNPRVSRYVSKNNLNIARTRVLRQLFPDSVVLIPFREPLQHAASLLTQHLNFLRIHREDPFASDYMRAIGHLDFGDNLCPVDFGAWFDQRASKHADCPTFWLEYWIAAYTCLLADMPGPIHFLGFDKLCSNPERSLQLLTDTIDSPGLVHPPGTETGIRPPTPRTIDTAAIPQSLIQKADHIYARLIEIALN